MAKRQKIDDLKSDHFDFLYLSVVSVTAGFESQPSASCWLLPLPRLIELCDSPEDSSCKYKSKYIELMTALKEKRNLVHFDMQDYFDVSNIKEWTPGPGGCKIYAFSEDELREIRENVKIGPCIDAMMLGCDGLLLQTAPSSTELNFRSLQIYNFFAF